MIQLFDFYPPHSPCHPSWVHHGTLSYLHISVFVGISWLAPHITGPANPDSRGLWEISEASHIYSNNLVHHQHNIPGRDEKWLLKSSSRAHIVAEQMPAFLIMWDLRYSYPYPCINCTAFISWVFNVRCWGQQSLHQPIRVQLCCGSDQSEGNMHELIGVWWLGCCQMVTEKLSMNWEPEHWDYIGQALLPGTDRLTWTMRWQTDKPGRCVGVCTRLKITLQSRGISMWIFNVINSPN